MFYTSQLRLVVYPIIYLGFLYIPGGRLGFLNHQQYHENLRGLTLPKWLKGQAGGISNPLRPYFQDRLAEVPLNFHDSIIKGLQKQHLPRMSITADKSFILCWSLKRGHDVATPPEKKKKRSFSQPWFYFKMQSGKKCTLLTWKSRESMRKKLHIPFWSWKAGSPARKESDPIEARKKKLTFHEILVVS